MIFSRQIRKIPFEQIAPFNDDDLMVMLSSEVAIVLRNIMNEDGKYFSIKNIMMNNDVFGCKDFKETCDEYSKIMHGRLERFFETKKSMHIFFDIEEQSFIKDIFTKNNISCIVDIYIKKINEFIKVPIELLEHSEYRKFRPFIKTLGIQAVISPEMYFNLNMLKKEFGDKATKRSPFSFRDIIDRKVRESNRIKKITEKYPIFKAVKNKKDFKDAYHKLCKELHSDTGGDDKLFIKMKEDVELLKKTQWYKKLKEGT